MRFEGVVVSGMKEAARYVAAYDDAFQQRFGVRFYPGTLNIKTVSPVPLEGGVEILPPKEGLHAVVCYPVTINETIKGCVVVPGVKKHPDTILEIMAPVNLRETLELADGDTITCESA